MNKFNCEKTVEFSEITDNEPFKSEGQIVTFADLDGVFFKYGKEASTEENVRRLHSLAKVVAKSDELVFWSSRIRVDEKSHFWQMMKPMFDGKTVSYFPFMTNKSVDRMESFAKNINPDCEVSSKIGLKKMKSCLGLKDDFTKIAINALERQNKLVIIGSSIIDRHRVKELAEEIKENKLNVNDLYYFDTGHWII